MNISEASLTDSSRGVIYDHDIFMLKATDLNYLSPCQFALIEYKINFTINF
jgi:hypothetical protein